MTKARYAKVLAATFMVSFLSLGGCKGCGTRTSPAAKDRPSLAGITIKPITPAHYRGTEIRVDEALVAAKAKQILADAQLFAPPEANRPVAQVTMGVEVFVVAGGDKSEIGAKVRLRVSLRPEGIPSRFGEYVEAIGQAPLVKDDIDDAKQSFQQLAERTVGDLLRAFASRQQLWEGSASDISAALQSSDNDVRVEGLRIVAARGLRSEIPTVLRLLSDDEESVRDAALGTVVALRERAAVKVLAASRHMRDVREMRKILDAMATLGGREAGEYLSFVAETHDDEEIRGMARSALERLAKHREGGVGN